jgi:hypothetical protein
MFANKRMIGFIQLVMAISLHLSSCTESNSGLLTGECKDTIRVRSNSPDQKFEAIALQRDCGATTSISTIISVRSVGISNNSTQNKIFIAKEKDNISLTWIDSRRLRISHGRGEIFLRREEINGILVEYEPRMKNHE